MRICDQHLEILRTNIEAAIHNLPMGEAPVESEAELRARAIIESHVRTRMSNVLSSAGYSYILHEQICPVCQHLKQTEDKTRVLEFWLNRLVVEELKSYLGNDQGDEETAQKAGRHRRGITLH